MPKKPKPNAKPTTYEVKLAAMAWAEFLYSEYMLEKHKQLLSDQQDTTMEKP